MCIKLAVRSSCCAGDPAPQNGFSVFVVISWTCMSLFQSSQNIAVPHQNSCVYFAPCSAVELSSGCCALLAFTSSERNPVDVFSRDVQEISKSWTIQSRKGQRQSYGGCFAFSESEASDLGRYVYAAQRFHAWVQQPQYLLAVTMDEMEQELVSYVGQLWERSEIEGLAGDTLAVEHVLRTRHTFACAWRMLSVQQKIEVPARASRHWSPSRLSIRPSLPRSSARLPARKATDMAPRWRGIAYAPDQLDRHLDGGAHRSHELDKWRAHPTVQVQGSSD